MVDSQPREFYVGQRIRMSVHYARRVEHFEYQGDDHPQWIKEKWLCRGNSYREGAGRIIRTWPSVWINPALEPEVDLPILPQDHGRAKCDHCAFEEGLFIRDDGTISRNFTP